MINDRINCILCTILGITSLFVVHKFCSIDYFLNKGYNIEKSNHSFVLLWTTLFAFAMLLRYFPCLNVRTEKHTYLILGTLIEETKNHVVEMGTFFLVPTISTISFYFISKWLVSISWYYIGYIAVGIFLLFSIVGFIKSIFS